MRCRVFIAVVLAVLPAVSHAGDENDPADLRLRIAPNETLKYVWTINSASESRGQEKGKSFTLTSDSASGMTLIMKGMPMKHDPQPLSIRFQNFSWREKRAIGESVVDATVSRGHMKCIENGKLTVDSDNDVGLDRIKEYEQHIKRMEEGEIRTTLDAAGLPGEIQGDTAMAETLKNGGAHGIFPILAGKELKSGESWEDSFNISEMGEFKLARPAVVRAKMTFSKWETKDGKRLARIDLTSAWDSQELRGENPDGMLAKIINVDCHGTGTCLFDPATGHYVDGSVTYSSRYRIEGESNGQSAGLDVTGKSKFTFMAQ